MSSSYISQPPSYVCSHSAAPALSSQTTSSVLESVTGISDWEFLKPDKGIPSETPLKENKKVKNPTLEDFDGEIAIFQVTMIN